MFGIGELTTVDECCGLIPYELGLQKNIGLAQGRETHSCELKRETQALEAVQQAIIRWQAGSLPPDVWQEPETLTRQGFCR